MPVSLRAGKAELRGFRDAFLFGNRVKALHVAPIGRDAT